ncbi:hypothetical protein B9T62_23280 [Paenibacillus donghaensis]|uniref:6-phosphogluconate dehydrogenase NADP-binding domain-containing protein n=2 Tax=Paenibacillus donghaensis TaxID=414771 RepID=A0A2Z2KJK3_9BACL|nr:NAD(P)-binding domain-containing protein [Paenibacillus donghaensis]ASA23470.1 hypothetical protein B9T62_23280 [Paenibacillus donghaensis]
MKIAILGTGLMGSAMGEAIINAGHQLIVYNRTPERTKPLVEKGAKAVFTAAQAISEADATIIVLLDGVAVKNLLLNEETLAVVNNKKIISAASSTVDEIIEIAVVVAQHGGQFAEMSMQAYANALRTATGTFVVGCNAEDEKFWVETLSSFSGGAQRVGEIGDATKIESVALVGSMISMINVGYSTAVAQKLGLAPEVYEPIINMMVPSAAYVLPKMITHDYNEIVGSIESYVSGLTTLIDIVKSKGMPTEVLEEMKKLFEKATTGGYAQKDRAAVLEVILNPRN